MKFIIPILLIGFVSNVFGQNHPDFEKILTTEFSIDSQVESNWVFFPDIANIEKVEKPLIKLLTPNYDIYSLNLVNYLGYHENEATCLVFFDSLKSKTLLIEPLWYGGVSSNLIKLFIGKRFSSKELLLNLLNELNELSEIGSVYKFVNPVFTDSLITYDLIYQKEDTYTTGNNISSSTIRYNEEGIWRKIKIDIKDLRIIRYTSINLTTNEEEIID
jgi:hypothetical protein